MFIDQDRAKDIIDRSTAEYQSLVQDLTGVITTVSAHVPRRRERKMHVGLFGYGRSLGGVGGVTLPRAIGFRRIAVLHRRPSRTSGSSPACRKAISSSSVKSIPTWTRT